MLRSRRQTLRQEDTRLARIHSPSDPSASSATSRPSAPPRLSAQYDPSASSNPSASFAPPGPSCSSSLTTQAGLSDATGLPDLSSFSGPGERRYPISLFIQQLTWHIAAFSTSTSIEPFESQLKMNAILYYISYRPTSDFVVGTRYLYWKASTVRYDFLICIRAYYRQLG